jgi:hypothetical protein
MKNKKSLEEVDKRIDFILRNKKQSPGETQYPGNNMYYDVSPNRTIQCLGKKVEKIACKIIKSFLQPLRSQPDYGEREQEIQEEMKKIEKQQEK